MSELQSPKLNNEMNEMKVLKSFKFLYYIYVCMSGIHHQAHNNTNRSKENYPRRDSEHTGGLL